MNPLKELISNSDGIYFVNEEIIKFLDPDTALSKVTLLLEGYFFKEELQKVNAKILSVKKEFPLAIEGTIQITFKAKVYEGVIPGLINLAELPKVSYALEKL